MRYRIMNIRKNWIQLFITALFCSSKQNSHSSTLALSHTLHLCLYPTSLPALLFGEKIIEITNITLTVMVIVDPDGNLRMKEINSPIKDEIAPNNTESNKIRLIL